MIFMTRWAMAYLNATELIDADRCGITENSISDRWRDADPKVPWMTLSSQINSIQYLWITFGLIIARSITHKLTIA